MSMTEAAAATMMTMEVKSLVELLLLLGKDFLNFSRLREKTNGFCSSLDLTTLVFSFKVGVSPSIFAHRWKITQNVSLEISHQFFAYQK